MPYKLQCLWGLIDAHPERAAPLRRHVEALEQSIESQPAFCLQNVRTLFEAAHLTIAPHLKVALSKNGAFPARMRAIIDALDFSIADHPDSATIHATIADLLKGIEDTAIALARLSNIPNMRHGGSLDWGTLQRQHAVMLGGLCDSLVSFLFDVAWRRPAVESMSTPAPDRYEDFAAFNAELEDQCGPIEIAGAIFQASRILFTLDRTAFDAAHAEWAAHQAPLAERSAA